MDMNQSFGDATSEHVIQDSFQVDTKTLESLLSVAKDEFAYTGEHYKNLDTRVLIFITLQAALLAFTTQINVGNTSIVLSFSSTLELLIFSSKLFLPVVLVILSLLSIWFLIQILRAKPYQRISIERLIQIDSTPLYYAKYEHMLATLIKEYSKCTLYNRMINQLKQIYYSTAMILTVVSVLLMIFLVILNNLA